MDDTNWLLCPLCKNQSQIKLRHDTALTNFPLTCSKCKQETLIDVRQFHTFIVVEREYFIHQQLAYKNMILSPQKRSVSIGGEGINLTRHEFNLLHYLMLNKGIVLTYGQISLRIWNDEYDGSGYGAIKNLVQRLRSKISLADNGDIVIQNVRGVGYCLPTHE